MNGSSRREFLADVGRGMFVASLGPVLAYELGLAPAYGGEEGAQRLTFGALEPLVTALQETPPDRLLPDLVARLSAGTDLKQLTAAAALANARAFGGEHYRGYHTFMALVPAYHMAMELSGPRQALPVLKVLYRNSAFIQADGAHEHDALHPIAPAEIPAGANAGDLLREANAQHDTERADRIFAAMAQGSPDQAFDDLLQFNVEDHAGVHEVVLAYRSYALLDFTGREHAQTLLRQSVRQCVDHSANADSRPADPRRALLPVLLDRHKLPSSMRNERVADDRWVQAMSETILSTAPDQASDAVAAALAEGFKTEHVGQAIALAANQLLLRQVAEWSGRYGRRTHGDSPGVHASDAVNAWRNIARVSSPRNAAAAMILAAYFVADSRRWATEQGGMANETFPRQEDMDRITVSDPEAILRDLDGAIRENDQLRACALVQKYGQAGHPERPVFDTLIRYSISEDGRLHAEKYYRTVAEEFAIGRPAFRWGQLTALARVNASGYGLDVDDKAAGRAPGYEEACRLLGVEA
jgi:hypothetical protein